MLTPENFPIVITSTRSLCNFSEQGNCFGNPSLALKIGHLLKKCAKIAKNPGINTGGQ